MALYWLSKYFQSELNNRITVFKRILFSDYKGWDDIAIHKYGLGRNRINMLGCPIAILSDILLATNMVISNLKMYIQVHSILTV